jgi:uncharacterized membrane protein
MEPRLEPQARRVPPDLPYDPNRALTWAHRTSGHLPAVVQAAGRRVLPRETRIGLAQAWIGIGLGLAGLLAPRVLARVGGLPDWPLMLRVIGARELASGLGLLTAPTSPVWRWTRLAGDVMDGAVLGSAFFAPSARQRRLAATAAIVGGIVALDVRAGAPRRARLSAQALPRSGGRREIRESLLINCSPEDCYATWRNVENLPRFMQHLAEVRVLDERISHWRAAAPGGSHVEWDAEISVDQPNQILAWRSLPGSQIENHGRVRFMPGPGGKGTRLNLELAYKPPAGAAGALVARLFGESPSQQVHGDLRRFKQLMETGEIPTTRGQSHGERSLKSRQFNKEAEQ